MRFDVSLPLVILAVILVAVTLYPRCRDRLRAFYAREKLKGKDVLLMVVIMAVGVAIISLIPQQAILIIFIGILSLGLFLLSYTLTERWYVGLTMAALFVSSYFLYWNDLELNIFAILFVTFLSIAMSEIFTWRLSWAFGGLLAVVDVIHVFGTKFMVSSTLKLVALRLPLTIIIPMFPSQGHIILGLGDILLAQLLTLQTYSRFGLRSALVCAASMAAAFILFETMQLNSSIQFFPATITVMFGAAISLGARSLVRPRFT